MDTNKSLLMRAKSDPESEAWFELVRIYDPLIAGWLRRQNVRQTDVPDLTQEVLYTLAQGLNEFEHNGRTGAFRNWLRTIAINRCRRYWQKKSRTEQTGASEEILRRLNELEDPGSDLTEIWNREHDNYVVGRILEIISREFDPNVIDSFRRSVLTGEAAGKIAEDLKISTGQVYKYKFRVMKRLNELVAGLIGQDGEFKGE